MPTSHELNYLLAANGYVVLDDVVSGQMRNAVAEQVRRSPVSVPGDASASLIALPPVMDVIQSVIGAMPILENVRLFRAATGPAGYHMPEYPTRDLEFFRMRVSDGVVRAGVVKVWYVIDHPVGIPCAYLLVGSHRSEISVPAAFADPTYVQSSAYHPLSASAGAAIVILEPALCAIPYDANYRDRLLVEFTYSHPALAYTRNVVSHAVRESIPRDLHCYLRDSWQYDFTTDPPTKNMFDRMLSLGGGDGSR